MFESQRARLAGIQLHVPLKLPGAFAGNALAFNLDDLVPGFHAGRFRERILRYLLYKKFFYDRVEKEPFAFQANGEPEFGLGRLAVRREHEQTQKDNRDPRRAGHANYRSSMHEPNLARRSPRRRFDKSQRSPTPQLHRQSANSRQYSPDLQGARECVAASRAPFG